MLRAVDLRELYSVSRKNEVSEIKESKKMKQLGTEHESGSFSIRSL